MLWLSELDEVPSLGHDRRIDHLALEVDGGQPRRGRCVVRRDEATCPLHLVHRRRERVVRELDLAGVDAELALVAHVPRRRRFRGERVVVVEVGHDLVDHRHTGEPTGQDGRRARRSGPPRSRRCVVPPMSAMKSSAPK